MGKKPHLWEFVSNWLCDQIIDGTFADGERIPSVRNLADRFDVSVASIQRAVIHLESLGMVHTIQRSGSFVLAPQGKLTSYDFTGVDVRVDKEVVAMLADASRSELCTLGSAVLSEDLAPEALLKRCIAAVARDPDSVSTFCPPPGNLGLRKQIAGLMIRRGVFCTAEDVIVTAGDTVAMELGLMATGKAQGKVIVEDPTYFGILQAIEHVGMRAVPIKTCREQGIDLDVIHQALQNGRYAAIFLNPSLQNPLGFVMPAHRRQLLVKIAARAGVTIIEDDVFSDLLPPTNRPPAIKSYDPNNVLYCSSFTKTIAPGFRVGWCVPGKHKNAILAQMFGRNLSVSSLPQMILAKFLCRSYREKHLISLRRSLQASKDRLVPILAAHFPPGYIYRSPIAGFVHWIELPKTVDMARFHFLVKEAGIVIAKGGIFSPTGSATHGLRICLTKNFSAEMHGLIAKVGACAVAALHPS